MTVLFDPASHAPRRQRTMAGWVRVLALACAVALAGCGGPGGTAQAV